MSGSNKYANNRALKKKEAISQIPSIDDDTNQLAERCKFNFHYFDVQPAGQNFSDWSQIELTDLLNKLNNYSETSLRYWATQNLGSSIGNVLQIYGNFPPSNKTDFNIPTNIPMDARWARFRLGSTVRVIGFIIPDKLHNTAHNITGSFFDKNTFYVVFLDKNHKFWKSEKK